MHITMSSLLEFYFYFPSISLIVQDVPPPHDMDLYQLELTCSIFLAWSRLVVNTHLVKR